LSGGLASVVAGHIVAIGADGTLRNFDIIGYVVVATGLVALLLVRHLHRSIQPGARRPAVA